MDRLLQDLRFAARVLLRKPGFTATALLVLGLGIGAGTAIFSVADAVLFRPLPFPDEGRLVTICETNPRIAGYCVASPPNVMDWRARSRSLEEVGLARWWHYTVAADAEARGVDVAIGTAGYLRALGAKPLIGRLLEERDLEAGAPRVVVLSEAYWRSEMGAAPDVLGGSLLLDGQSATIVGVLDGEVRLPELEGARLWLPLHFSPFDEERREWRGFMTAARLAPGASLERAREELAGLQAALAEEHPAANEGWGIEVRGLRDHVVAGVRPTLITFLGAAGILLLIVCANLAALLLVRATARHRELTIRAALGAGRDRLARHASTEALLLALAGGALGVAAASWCVDLLVALAPPGMPRLSEVGVDGRVLAFATGTTLVVAGLIAVLPALRAAAVDLAASLREGQPVASRSVGRMRAGLVVTEVALSVALLAGAVVLLKSFAGLTRWQPGFDTENVLLLSAFAPGDRYTREELPGLWRRAEEAVAAVPGVQAVATVSAGPLFGGRETDALEEVDGVAQRDAPPVRWYDAGPGYFAALGVPLIAGRDLSESDRAGSPRVAVVNRTLARRLWPDEDPLGRRLRLSMYEEELEVVGVVADVPPFYPGSAPDAEVWWSNRQEVRGATFFVVRTTIDPTLVAGSAADALTSVDPGLEPGIRTLREGVSTRLVRPRFAAVLVGGFAAVALILALVGVYGTIAYTVALRRREIGIRMALGADARKVRRRVLRQGAILAGAGAALGLALALLLGRFLADLVYGIAPADPGSLLLAVALVWLTAMVASLGPARGASRTQPTEALRAE